MYSHQQQAAPSFPTPRVTVVPGVIEDENLEPRAQLTVIVDLSGSMERFFIMLIHVWQQLIQKLLKTHTNRLRLEVAFGGFLTDVEFHDFAPLPYLKDLNLSLAPGGYSPLGTALNISTTRLVERRDLLSRQGVHLYRSVVVVITDAHATDVPVLVETMPKLRQLEAAGVVEVVPVALDEICVPQLVAVFGKRPSFVDDLDFRALFDALSRSMSQYSRSCPGHEPSVGELLGRAYWEGKSLPLLPVPPRLPKG